MFKFMKIRFLANQYHSTGFVFHLYGIAQKNSTNGAAKRNKTALKKSYKTKKHSCEKELLYY